MKARIRIRQNEKTVTILKPNSKWDYQVVHNDDIKKADSFVSLFMARREQWLKAGGILAKNADNWLELVKVA
jgi:choline kinase